MKSYPALILIVFCLNASCRLTIAPDNRGALNELVKKYPEFYKYDLIDEFEITRTVTDNYAHVQMQLLKADHGYEQIVILSNDAGQIYAVPFPDNDHRDYWRFYEENLKRISKSNEKTFGAEMNKAFQMFTMNENSRKLINDLMVALLETQPIQVNDTSLVKAYPVDKDFPDSCRIIHNANYKSILKVMNPKPGDWRFNAYWSGDRDYQIDWITNKRTQSINYEIKVYRRPCTIKPIYM